MIHNRIKLLRDSMSSLGLEALLITDAFNRHYMTGFTGSSGLVLLTHEEAFLLTDFRYMSQAPQQAALYQVIEHQPQAMKTVRELLERFKLDSLGFEQNQITYGAYLSCVTDLGANIKLIPTDQLVEKLRMRKDQGELNIMQEAADLADQTFAHIIKLIKPGMKEIDVALEIEFYMRSHGAASSSFETIVASGERSALPHGVASNRVIQQDEFVKLDFGAFYHGYCSDITRTVAIGKPSLKHREIYSIVLEAQLHALDNIKPGMTGRQADALTRDIIQRYGYGSHFGHGTGHGLGMQIHEAPRLSQHSDMILEQGMTVTVEPGIYVPGFGGVRIEDDVVITETGVRLLTHSTKEFIVID